MLATTALPAGYPLLSGNTWDGWGQLNLYAAADGYGAFNSNVTVSMDASQGGYNAADTWANNISGVGKFTKQGTGELTFTGNNSFSGGVEVDGGRLVAASATALGTGAVSLMGGTLVDAVSGTLRIGGSLTQTAASTLEFDMTGSLSQELSVAGSVTLRGMLVLDFINGLPTGSEDIVSIASDTSITGDFSAVDIIGIGEAYTTSEVRTADGIEFDITAVPEPANWGLLAFGVVGVFALRRAAAGRLGVGRWRIASEAGALTER